MPDYDSPFFITNDRADIDQARIEDGTAVVWPLSDDAKLVRSPDRQYCGNYVTYGDKGAATYRHNADTHALIAAGPNQHRDMTSSFPLVKTVTKARARGDRQLLDVQDQDVRITTRLVDIPATRVTLAKAGMRLQIKGTHWGPTCDDWHYGRIVSAQPRPHSDGSLFDIDLEIVIGTPVEDFVSPGPPAPDHSGNVFAGLQRTQIYGFSSPHFVGYQYNYDDNPAPGFDSQATTGPIEIVETSDPYLTIRALAPMVVGLYAAGQGAEVYIPPQTKFLSITVNGVVVGTDSASTATGFDAWTRQVDVHDYHLEAGDEVSVIGTLGDDWGNVAINNTYLIVVRGTFTMGSGTVWTGP